LIFSIKTNQSPHTPYGTNSTSGAVYELAFSTLQKGYSPIWFLNAIMTFKEGSQKNMNGAYTPYPLIRGTPRALLPAFYPFNTETKI